MENSSEDIDKYCMEHESDKEWCMRRAFLLAHRDKFLDSRLRCLASCYINVTCYGCRYPNALMCQLEELAVELPKQGSPSSDKRGLPQSIRFVPAGQTDNKSESSASQISEVQLPAPDTVNPQSCVSKSSNSVPQCSAKLSRLEASFHCLADKLKEVYCSKSLTESKNVPELLQIAVDKARMSATTHFTELGPGKGFCCSLLLDFVLVSSGQAQNKRLAKHSAYVAAAELLRKPYLLVSEDAKPGVSNLQLVTSHYPFVRENSAPQQHVADSTNTAVLLPPRMSAVKQLMDMAPAHFTERSHVQSGCKRSSDSLCRASLKNFVILQSANAVNVIQQSANFNKWPFEYDTSEMAGCCRCRVILGGHVLSDAVGENKSAAKTAAAEQALKQLESTCCTVVIKKVEDIEPDDTLTRSEVLSGKEKDTQIPDSNVGSQLLKKMGWTGGGVGKDDNRGIVEPVSLMAVVNRAGLGSAQLSDFEPSVKRVIDEFFRSDGRDDLVFSPEFTKEERAVIHAEARKRHLKTRSYGSGNQRHLILSLQRTPLELVAHLRAHGGETVKYSLIEPKST